MIRTVSSPGVISAMRAAQNPVARRSPVKLRVAHPVRNAGQSLIGVRHPDILGLPTVNTAAESPASERVAAVVHISMAAEETFSAECLDVDRHPVARTDIVHGRTHSLHHPDHLVSEGDAGHSPRHAPVQDMQVTCTDAPESHPHQGVARPLQLRHRFVRQSGPAVSKIRISLHCPSDPAGK